MKNLLPLSLAVTLFLGSTVSAAPIQYQITLNTASQQGNQGYLDFQFIPGAGAAAATADISDFELIGGGSLLAPSGSIFPLPYATPTASGDLGSVVTIQNTDGFNAFLQELIFGSSVQFLLTLSGPALDTSGNAGGTDFALYAYDSNGATILGGSNAAGAAALVSIDPDGGTADTTGAGGATVTAVPEPGYSLLLVVVGIGLGAFSKKRR